MIIFIPPQTARDAMDFLHSMDEVVLIHFRADMFIRLIF